MDDYCYAPDCISHEALLYVIEARYLTFFESENTSVYFMQLRQTLLSLARKARLEVAAQQLTGLPPADVHAKTTTELLSLLDKNRAASCYTENLLRYWW